MDKLREKDIPFVVNAAGGGSGFARQLMGQGGMGGVVAAFHLLNHRDAIVAKIGGTPDRFASAEAAESLAVTAFRECSTLTGRGFGIGVACALAGPGEREGRTARAFLCLQTGRSATAVELGWRPGGSRLEQEGQVAAYGEMLALMGAGLYPQQLDSKVHELRMRSGLLTEGHGAVFRGEAPNDRLRRGGPILCTAANPIHAGHVAMIRAAAATLGTTVDVEIAIQNAAKPSIGTLSIVQRLAGARDKLKGEPVGQIYLSNKGRFADKMRHDVGVTWLIGADTFNRIPTDEMWPQEGHEFMVFERCGPDGEIIEPNRPLLPPFWAYEGEWTPNGLSSTEIRKGSDGKRCS